MVAGGNKATSSEKGKVIKKMDANSRWWGPPSLSSAKENSREICNRKYEWDIEYKI